MATTKRKIQTLNRKSTKLNKRRNPKPTKDEIDKAINDLIYPHDGPVTKFVILSRATELASKKTYSPEVLANAAYEIINFYRD